MVMPFVGQVLKCVDASAFCFVFSFLFVVANFYKMSKASAIKRKDIFLNTP